MGSALTQAVGIAISPLPIVLVILMLVSRRARVNGLAFLVGWVAATLAVSALAFALAGAAVAATGATGSTAAAALAVFVLVASATVILPVVVFFALGERSVQLLDGWKAWLVANNATIMTVLFTVLGANLLADGLALFP